MGGEDCAKSLGSLQRPGSLPVGNAYAERDPTGNDVPLRQRRHHVGGFLQGDLGFDGVGAAPAHVIEHR